MSTAVESPGLVLLQLNVKGLTTAKLNIVQQIIIKNNLTIVVLQETHTDNKKFFKLPGFLLTSHTANKHHGIATYVQSDIPWTAIAHNQQMMLRLSGQELKCKTPPLSTSTSHLQASWFILHYQMFLSLLCMLVNLTANTQTGHARTPMLMVTP